MKFTKFFVGALAVAAMMSCGNGTKKCDSACADSACVAVKVELPIAVQLYSVRGDMEADFVGTLAKVKGMGYDGVEFAGLFGNAPEQVKHWCDSLGLDAVSAHVPLADMLNITRQTAVLAFQYGDGISNTFWFTNGTLLIYLGLAKVPLQKWYKFIMPLHGLFFILEFVFLFIAVQIGYGPF